MNLTVVPVTLRLRRLPVGTHPPHDRRDDISNTIHDELTFNFLCEINLTGICF